MAKKTTRVNGKANKKASKSNNANETSELILQVSQQDAVTILNGLASLPLGQSMNTYAKVQMQLQKQINMNAALQNGIAGDGRPDAAGSH